MKINENGRLGAALFYAQRAKRTDEGKSTDKFRRFADIKYSDYDYASLINKGYKGNVDLLSW